MPCRKSTALCRSPSPLAGLSNQSREVLRRKETLLCRHGCCTATHDVAALIQLSQIKTAPTQARRRCLPGSPSPHSNQPLDPESRDSQRHGEFLFKTSLSRLRTEWLGNIKGDLLSGLVVALALIPEAIAFSIIAGVDPKVGLYASFSIAVITAIVGGRPAHDLGRDGGHGRADGDAGEGTRAAVPAGRRRSWPASCRSRRASCGWATSCASCRKSVMTGFVNALAILIFMAQLPELIGVTWMTYVMVAAGLAIIYGLPRLTKAVPSPLVCIVVLTVAAIVLRHRRPHRRRHGRAALDPAGVPAARRSAQPRDAADHAALFASPWRRSACSNR